MDVYNNKYHDIYKNVADGYFCINEKDKHINTIYPEADRNIIFNKYMDLIINNNDEIDSIKRYVNIITELKDGRKYIFDTLEEKQKFDQWFNAYNLDMLSFLMDDEELNEKKEITEREMER